MKILFFIDTHNIPRLRRVLEKAHDADLIVCGGDFTIFEDHMHEALNMINSASKPVLLIHGNHESATSTITESAGMKNITFAHKSAIVVENCIFFCYGGGGFSMHDERFTREMEHLLAHNTDVVRSKRLILVTHAPPYGTRLDDIGEGEHVGNKDIAQFITKHQPTLSVSGHIHECAGNEDKIDHTRLLNPGWEGVIIEL